MNWKLFIDDERVGPQHKDWEFAPNYEEAIKMISVLGMPDEISLDHDIWTGRIQGTEFCEWLKTQKLPSNFSYRIHSSNKVGAKNMETILTKITGKPPKSKEQWW